MPTFEPAPAPLGAGWVPPPPGPTGIDPSTGVGLPPPPGPAPAGWVAPPGSAWAAGGAPGSWDPRLADPGYAPRSAWTVASLVLLVLAAVAGVVGVVGTVAAFTRDTPEGEFEEGWAEFAWLFGTVLGVIALVGLAAACAVIGALVSWGKGRMRPIVIVTLALAVPPTALLLLHALSPALGL